MKKKIVIVIIIIAILAIAGLVGYLYLKNNNDDKEKEEETPEDLYADFVKIKLDEYEEQGNNVDGLGYFFLDLDNDDIPELITGKGYFSSDFGMIYKDITIYSIVDGAVKEISKLLSTEEICLVYDINNDKYLYGLANLELPDTDESMTYTEDDKKITKIKVIESTSSNIKEYDPSSKEYIEKYITIPGSEKIIKNADIEVVFPETDKLKSNVKDNFENIETIDDVKSNFIFDIEELKKENESKLNAPDSAEAEKIGEEMLDYIVNFSSNVKLANKDTDIGSVSYAREILDYEGQFENKFTQKFIDSYFSINNAGPGYIEEYKGKMYLISPGIGGRMDYIGEEMSLKEATENKLTFTLTGYYYKDMNDIEKGVTSTENLKEELEKANIEYTTETEEMVLVKEDNVWKIDEYDDLAI